MSPARHASSRRPGRPTRPAEGPADHRERLLDAAVGEFSRRGVAGTSIRAIATAAGVTPALVHYYFPERDQLLDAVVDERLAPLMLQVFPAEPPPGPVEPADLLAGLAERLIRLASATPWLPGLWLREIAGVDGQLHARVLDRMGLRRSAVVLGLLAAAREQGRIHADLQPPLLMASLVGLAMLPLATRHVWQRMPGAEGIDDDVLVRHVTTLLRHGLSPHGTPQV